MDFIGEDQFSLFPVTGGRDVYIYIRVRTKNANELSRDETRNFRVFSIQVT